MRVGEAECVELGGDGGGERHPRQALRVLGAGGGVVRHDVQRYLSLEIIIVSFRAHYHYKSLVQCDQCPHLLPCLRGPQLLVVGHVGEGEAAEDAESLDEALVVGGEDPGLLVDERHHADDVLVSVPERREIGKNI